MVWLVAHHRGKPPVELRGPNDILTVASTGDWSTHDPLPSDPGDDRLTGVAAILRNSSLGLTNLEETLLERARDSDTGKPGMQRPYGSSRQAQDMKRLGVTVVSLANNHVMDYGVEGMKDTGEIVERAGLLHAGCGGNLQLAGAPSTLGSPPTRIAVMAVTTSAEAESRATYAQGEILGRPG